MEKLNANKVADDDYLRLMNIMAREAYDCCKHKSRLIERCSKRGLCYEEGIVNFHFSELVKWN